jgi:hypothetical protein
MARPIIENKYFRYAFLHGTYTKTLVALLAWRDRLRMFKQRKESAP